MLGETDAAVKAGDTVLKEVTEWINHARK